MASEPTRDADHVAVLRCPMPNGNAPGANTVGEYLLHLLGAVWNQGEGFSGKRPFGDSGWEYDIYIALAQGGFVSLVMDEDGYVAEFDKAEEKKANQLIFGAIRTMGALIDGDVSGRG